MGPCGDFRHLQRPVSSVPHGGEPTECAGQGVCTPARRSFPALCRRFSRGPGQRLVQGLSLTARPRTMRTCWVAQVEGDVVATLLDGGGGTARSGMRTAVKARTASRSETLLLAGGEAVDGQGDDDDGAVEELVPQGRYAGQQPGRRAAAHREQVPAAPDRRRDPGSLSRWLLPPRAHRSFAFGDQSSVRGPS